MKIWPKPLTEKNVLENSWACEKISSDYFTPFELGDIAFISWADRMENLIYAQIEFDLNLEIKNFKLESSNATKPHIFSEVGLP